MAVNEHRGFEFEDFRLDSKHLLLFRGDSQLDLSPKVVETLVALVQSNGHVIHKDELMRQVWPDTIVDESNLFQNLYILRKTLGNKTDGTPFIETLRRRGYRFSADVSPVSGNFEPASVDGEVSKPVVDRQFSNGSLVVAGVLLLFLFITVVASVMYKPWRSGMDTALPRRFPTSIVVLPFRSGRTGDEPIGLNITNALITRLGSRRYIDVRPTSAVLKYAAPDQDPVEVGQMQGVDAVLDGTLQRDGDRIRLTVQLIDTLSGATIWSSQIDTVETNPLELQDRISESVLAGMDRDLAPSE